MAKESSNHSQNGVSFARVLSTATIDADRGLVCVIGHDLMALAIEEARKIGVGVVTMYNGGDAGRLGYYAALATAQNMVGIVASAQGLRAVPVFGSEPRFGTNPHCNCGARKKSEVPLIFDTATTASVRLVAECVSRRCPVSRGHNR
jgi:LDH2 family malate/lactate/ureidoglycolate dehydrogenase